MLDVLIQQVLRQQAQQAAAGQQDQLASWEEMVVYLERELGRRWGLRVKRLPPARLQGLYAIYQSLCPNSRPGVFQSSHTNYYPPVLGYSAQAPDAVTENPRVSFLEAWHASRPQQNSYIKTGQEANPKDTNTAHEWELNDIRNAEALRDTQVSNVELKIAIGMYSYGDQKGKSAIWTVSVSLLLLSSEALTSLPRKCKNLFYPEEAILGIIRPRVPKGHQRITWVCVGKTLRLMNQASKYPH